MRAMLPPLSGWEVSLLFAFLFVAVLAALAFGIAAAVKNERLEGLRPPADHGHPPPTFRSRR